MIVTVKKALNPRSPSSVSLRDLIAGFMKRFYSAAGSQLVICVQNLAALPTKRNQFRPWSRLPIVSPKLPVRSFSDDRSYESCRRLERANRPFFGICTFQYLRLARCEGYTETVQRDVQPRTPGFDISFLTRPAKEKSFGARIRWKGTPFGHFARREIAHGNFIGRKIEANKLQVNSDFTVQTE